MWAEAGCEIAVMYDDVMLGMLAVDVSSGI